MRRATGSILIVFMSFLLSGVPLLALDTFELDGGLFLITSTDPDSAPSPLLPAAGVTLPTRRKLWIFDLEYSFLLSGTYYQYANNRASPAEPDFRDFAVPCILADLRGSYTFLRRELFSLGTNRTLFYHSRFELPAQTETEVEALTYRKSYGFKDALKTAVIKSLLAEARKQLDVPGVSTAYQLQIRSSAHPLIRRYEYHPPDFASSDEIRLHSLSGVTSGESFLLLLPDGLLLRGRAGSRQVRRLPLPPLPPDHVYNHLLIHEGRLIACWEQTAFTEVGAAGIFFAPFPYIP